jgi:hypothetical protein
VPRKMTVDRLSCKVVRCFELRHCAARLHRTQAKLRWPLQQASGARFLLGTRRHSNHRLRVSISSIMRGMGARSMACKYAASRRGARAPSSLVFPPSPGLYVEGHRHEHDILFKLYSSKTRRLETDGTARSSAPSCVCMAPRTLDSTQYTVRAYFVKTKSTCG